MKKWTESVYVWRYRNSRGDSCPQISLQHLFDIPWIFQLNILSHCFKYYWYSFFPTNKHISKIWSNTFGGKGSVGGEACRPPIPFDSYKGHWGLRGFDIPKDIITRPFNYAEQNDYLKIFIGYVWGNDERKGRGWLPLNPIWLLKKALELSNSIWMRSFRSFYDSSSYAKYLRWKIIK